MAKITEEQEREVLRRAFEEKYGKSPEEMLEEDRAKNTNTYMVGQKCDKCGKRFKLTDNFISLVKGVIDEYDPVDDDYVSSDAKIVVLHDACFRDGMAAHLINIKES